MEHFLKKYSNISILTLGVLFFIALFQSQNFQLDASSDTLILENDEDLKNYRKIINDYSTKDFLLITITSPNKILSKENLDLIKNLTNDVSKLMFVDSIQSILDAPILKSDNQSLTDLVDTQITLESKNLNLLTVEKEFTESPIFSELIISKDGTTSGIIINLKENRDFVDISKNRNDLKSVNNLTKSQKKKLSLIEKEYEKNPEKGIGMINQLGSYVKMKVTDKKQEKGKLFLKFGDNIQEDAAVDAANLKAKQVEELERLKQRHEEELEALTDRHERETEKVNQQKEKETLDKQIQSKRDAERKAAEKQNEERDYKKEYADYHSKPEQIKRRAKRNEARRMLKNRKGIKGKDVHHKDNNPMNNDKSNLSIVSQKYNRTEPRLRKLKEKGILPSGRK